MRRGSAPQQIHPYRLSFHPPIRPHPRRGSGAAGGILLGAKSSSLGACGRRADARPRARIISSLITSACIHLSFLLGGWAMSSRPSRQHAHITTKLINAALALVPNKHPRCSVLPVTPLPHRDGPPFAYIPFPLNPVIYCHPTFTEYRPEINRNRCILLLNSTQRRYFILKRAPLSPTHRPTGHSMTPTLDVRTFSNDFFLGPL